MHRVIPADLHGPCRECGSEVSWNDDDKIWVHEVTMTVPLTEAEFQRQVTDLASRLGWSWLHIERMGDYRGRWRTPVSGPLGSGWPDLVLIRRSSLIWAELKSQRGQLTEDQKRVRIPLGGVGHYYVWRPSDFPQILEVLSNA